MKKLVVCLLFVALCFSFSACSLSDTSLLFENAAIELMNGEKEITVSAGEKADYYIKINAGDDFPIGEVQCISENNSVAYAQYRHTLWESELHYYINGVSQGETYIYFSTPDGKAQSEKIRVTVLPQNLSETTLAQANAGFEKSALINTLFLQTGQTSDKFAFSISGLNGYSKDNIELVSENPLVATVWYDALTSAEQIFFSVTGVSEGETAVYLTSKDGAMLSDKTQIVVKSPYIAETTATDESNSAIITENSTQRETTTAVASTPAEIPETVYITPTGKKYHFKATCAGKNAQALSLSDAKSSYEPCKRCAHE